MTILLEVAEIARFPSAGGFCRLLPHCGSSKNQQREEKKAGNNHKCANRYLAWAFIEAANLNSPLR
jgi:hypothetical protein